jgi:preprotein translocase subunit SecA
MLRVIDEKWMDHIDAMDQLREGINLRAYGQRDPLIEYKFEAFDAYQIMEESIKEDVTRYLFRIRLVSQPQERTMVANREDEGPRQPVKADKKVGRNDPCPCGSGKKYKKCCGKGVS